jgi:hypothetical protein
MVDGEGSKLLFDGNDSGVTVQRLVLLVKANFMTSFRFEADRAIPDWTPLWRHIRIHVSFKLRNTIIIPNCEPDGYKRIHLKGCRFHPSAWSSTLCHYFSEVISKS